MIEIRLLSGHELQWAVNTASEVFETCVRGCVRMQEEINQFYAYASAEYLWQEMSAGRLYLWGAFEDGIMCAVSSMQNVGHITMLYVKPGFWHRNIGGQMLNAMFLYASSVLHQNRVTVNVTPVVAAPYFYRRGFVLIPGASLDRPFVPLEYRFMPAYASAGWNMTCENPVQGKPEVVYPEKKVRTKTVLILTAVVLLLAFGIGTGVTITHMVRDGMTAETGYDGEELPEGFGDTREL